ncbi:hypothetical protein JTE90_019534 [Oedothorax gibbosus]|uniref:Non-canonical purine NTP phosphatase/PRRC1 domain-containing protein n=1 Tax=Oedothorax gibbosus TaxID=931172 RepID=A0AAV6VHD3_9ARAC|nr:hypothetical protein JTE90_019534 [Oedothorax gibbosus]
MIEKPDNFQAKKQNKRIFKSNMMEEVSDDNNGESTFEFVGAQSEENGKDKSVQDEAKGTGIPQTGLFSSFHELSNVETSVLPPSGSLPSSAQSSGIAFYDPSQYSSSNSVLMSPFPEQPVSSTQLPHFAPAPQSTPTISSQSSTAAIQSPVPQSSYADCSVALPGNMEDTSLPQESSEGSVWGWIKGNQILNKFAEKAKSSVDSVITTLDPGMKEIINSGGDVNVVVASGNEVKISAVREAFQLVFGKATVQGMAVQSSSIAPQPVGFSAGLKAAEERISNLRQGLLQGNLVIVAVENFIAELTPDNWFDIGCLLLQDHSSGISLQVYTEAIPVASHFVQQAKDQTPADFPLGWSGHAVTIGQVMGTALGVHHSEWHQALTGVPRRDILFMAAKTIAGLYKSQLQR